MDRGRLASAWQRMTRDASGQQDHDQRYSECHASNFSQISPSCVGPHWLLGHFLSKQIANRMTLDCPWKFHVTGSLMRSESAPVLEPYEVIVESGIRDADSPHALRSVGAIARPDADGLFSTTFVTQGATTPPEPPAVVSVFVRESLGKWQAYIVSVSPDNVRRTAATELHLDLGAVSIGQAQLLYVGGKG